MVVIVKIWDEQAKADDTPSNCFASKKFIRFKFKCFHLSQKI